MPDEHAPVMEFALEFSFLESGSSSPVSGKGKTRLSGEEISVLPEDGDVLVFQYRDLSGISAKDFRVEIVTAWNEKIELYNLGYKFEDFLRVLNKLRNELVEKDMLIGETVLKAGVKAEVEIQYPEKQTAERAECEIKLLETSIVFTPDKAEVKRIPFSRISGISSEDYKITVAEESGIKYVFLKMGTQYDPFRKKLAGAINELSLRAQTLIKEIAPEAESQAVRKAAGLMKDGKAVCKKEIDLISPVLWKKFEKKIESLNYLNEYSFLKSLSREDSICIGLKRGLMGSLTGDYIWFLFPVYGAGPSKPGNAIAMESVSEEEGGKATYFFRICGRKEYKKLQDTEALRKEADSIVKTINNCMLSINFRREPVYLSEEKLEDPKYLRYKYSVIRLPELRLLHGLLIGRVIHSSPEQWKEDVMNLLKFNVDSENDSEKWAKNN